VSKEKETNMSDEILLKASDARAAATKVQQAATNATADFNTLKQELASLSEYFRGKSAEAFAARHHEWHDNAVKLNEALEALGKFLNGAADTIEGVDQQLQSQLNG
jgi:WXG100 family type VII secretion target